MTSGGQILAEIGAKRGSTTAPGARTSDVPPQWFGQPRGLTILFLTETWEKFSFFGMRALLVYYMTKSLGFSSAKASLVYGAYTGFVYFTPILGGFISDRALGRRRAVILGGVLMALGHFLMAFPALLYVALAAIAIGNGFYLPNLPSQVDGLYAKDDPRRGSAFNVYYVGINLGAFLAPLVCGTLGELWGWHWGFGAAGVGMCLGLLIYVVGARHLPKEAPRLRVASPTSPADQVRGRLPLLFALFLAIVIYRGAYEQIGNSIALWADADIDRRAFGFLIPGSWFQSLNPLLVFALTPIVVVVWTRLARQGLEPSSMRKTLVGALGMSLAYALLVVVVQVAAAAHVRPTAIALAGFIVVYTMSELFILPVSLGLFSRLAGDRHRATIIALYFFSASLGNIFAGAIGSFWTRVDHATFFGICAAVPALAAAVLFFLDRPARLVEARSQAADQGWRAVPAPLE